MTQIEKIVDKFLNTNEKKMYNNYATDGKVLVFVDPIKKAKDLIAIKFPNIVLGNSSVLELVRQKETGQAYHSSNRGISEIQTNLSSKITMVPFSVFKEAKVDLSKFELLEKGKEETLKRYRIEVKFDKTIGKYGENVEKRIDFDQHFTGACLFKIQGEVYLFDIDRNEIAHNIVNPFLVNISDKTVKTIKDAYNSLKPQSVKDAEKDGLNVKRQGEWFFIPTKLTGAFIKENYKKVVSRRFIDNQQQEERSVFPELILRAGPNRPNRAKLGFQHNGIVYVNGKISHTGREHQDLNLSDWHIAIPNTATKSWTVTGDVD